eukprot:1191451-Prorocentrum_minimum.AAC.1
MAIIQLFMLLQREIAIRFSPFCIRQPGRPAGTGNTTWPVYWQGSPSPRPEACCACRASTAASRPSLSPGRARHGHMAFCPTVRVEL